MQSKVHMRTQWEGSFLQSRQRSLTRNQFWQHLNPRTLRTVKTSFLWCKPLSPVFCYGSWADQYKWSLTSICKTYCQFRKLLKHSIYDHGANGYSGLCWHSRKEEMVVTSSKKFSDADSQGEAGCCNCQCWETWGLCAPAWFDCIQLLLWQAGQSDASYLHLQVESSNS